MKRTLSILIPTILLTLAACWLGIHTAKLAQEMEQDAVRFEEACIRQEKEEAQQTLERAGQHWESRQTLYHSLCRLETCMGIERCLQEMEQALSEEVYEDAISAARELQRLCGEIGHLGIPEWSDVL